MANGAAEGLHTRTRRARDAEPLPAMRAILMSMSLRNDKAQSCELG
jgi:hypothetical protein